MTLAVGIDIAKAKFDAAFTDAAGRRYHAVFANTPAGFRLLRRWLRGWGTPYLVMEATGSYWQALALYAHRLGWLVSVVNPQQSHAYSVCVGSRSKTDKLDAFLLARFGARERPALWQPLPAAVEQLEGLTRQLAHVQKQLGIESLRLASAKAEMRPYIARCAAFLQAEEQQLLADIARHIASDEALAAQHRLLCSIAGIGKKTAPILLAFIASAGRGKNAKQLASLAGLAPRHCQSGSSVQGQSRIGRGGRSAVKRALFIPAVAAGFGKHAKFRAYAERLEQAGKRRKVIVIALMRKLLTIACAVLRTGKPFDPALHGMAAAGNSPKAAQSVR